MIAVIDYDAGNTRNVLRALEAIGVNAVLSSDPEVLRQADGLILPGVGAFKQAMQALDDRDLIAVIHERVAQQVPLLGICLGMQLLVEASEEYGYTKGLSLIPGTCRALTATSDYPVPHMGWNRLHVFSPDALTEDVDQAYVYFVHSYYTDVPEAYLRTFSDYNGRIPAMISKGHVFGAQFHPEKSGDIGHKILKNFKEYVYGDSTSN